MKHSRYIMLPVALLLLLSLCACAGGGADVSPAAPLAPPTPPAVTEESPPQLPATPPSADDTESPAQIPEDDNEPAAPKDLSGELVITFDFVRQSGSASNQHAVWIEDFNGNVVRTLFASRWTANGGYKTRPDSIAIWVQRASLVNMTSTEVDAVSGATPRTGPQSYTWDLTDANWDIVPPGDYVFFVEGTLRWKNYVLYSGAVTLGDEPVTVQANAEFIYEGDGRYAILTPDSDENNMIGPVTAVFTPTIGN